MDKLVVVARYNEDLEWICNLDCPIIIYNKGKPWRTVCIPSNYSVNIWGTDLSNVGREAQTYLYHIKENYDNLADVTIFLQGNPFEHTGARFNILDVINKLDVDSCTFRPFGRRVVCDQWGRPQYNWGVIPMAGCWSVLFPDEGDCPEYFTFSIGAQFAVHKDLILKRPKIWYERAEALSRSYLGRYHSLAGTTTSHMTHTLERTWSYIFQGKEVNK
jgi:hypothetical protein